MAVYFLHFLALFKDKLGALERLDVGPRRRYDHHQHKIRLAPIAHLSGPRRVEARNVEWKCELAALYALAIVAAVR